jgi:hypothetical protein
VEVAVTAGKARLWAGLFAAAALFNFAIGIPLMVARHWTLALAFRPEILQGNNLAPHLWSDFGYCVALIGVGYLIVAFDITRNRALVWLGIFAKAYDVVILTWRFLIDIARPIVLVPAAIDAAFFLLFVWFLYATRRDEGLPSRQPEAAC